MTLGISFNLLARIEKNESILMDNIEKICRTRSCDVGDIMEIIEIGRNKRKREI